MGGEGKAAAQKRERFNFLSLQEIMGKELTKRKKTNVEVEGSTQASVL